MKEELKDMFVDIYDVSNNPTKQDLIRMLVVSTVERFIEAHKIERLQYKSRYSKQNTWKINDELCNVSDVRHKLSQFMKNQLNIKSIEAYDYNILQKMLHQFTYRALIKDY